MQFKNSVLCECLLIPGQLTTGTAQPDVQIIQEMVRDSMGIYHTEKRTKYSVAIVLA